MSEKTYRPGEVAELCGVGVRTVAKWIDTGLLKGQRYPGSLHRRVFRADLVQFIKEHKIPIDVETL